MGSKKLLKKLSDFFDMDARARAQKKEELNELLSRLKKKEYELIEQRDRETDKEILDKLFQKIDVVHSQRKKGIKLMKQLKAEAAAADD